jgi:hypothetical protein
MESHGWLVKILLGIGVSVALDDAAPMDENESIFTQ